MKTKSKPLSTKSKPLSTKPLFKNYDFSFDKNDKKIITTFCKQVVSQTTGKSDLAPMNRIFQGILDKLSSGADPIKLTKEEKSRLAEQIKSNLIHIQKESTKVWFFKKWLYKSLINQYKRILSQHFED
ncbi:MAG: hypothetical protein IAE91_10395 [Ignavibacteriaceae bacterium]|nr:hypothetical protein [Ignavibacteriaceae bacterium]